MEEFDAGNVSRAKEIKSHAIAFLMLALSLFALYTHALYLAIIPLLWMSFRAGKARGREEAQHEFEHARALVQQLKFPEYERRKTVRAVASNQLTHVPQR